MKIDYLPRALKALEDAPAEVREAFFKQVKFLEQNLRHPSLQAKKYDEGQRSLASASEPGLEVVLQHSGRHLYNPRYHSPPQISFPAAPRVQARHTYRSLLLARVTACQLLTLLVFGVAYVIGFVDFSSAGNVHTGAASRISSSTLPNFSKFLRNRALNSWAAWSYAAVSLHWARAFKSSGGTPGALFGTMT